MVIIVVMSPSRSRSRTRTPASEQSTDAELVELGAERDQRAWAILVDRYRRLIYTIPYRMGLDPAEADEVFQLTFTRLAERIDTLENPSRVRAWLVTTARRLALNSVARRKPLESSEEVLGGIVDPLDLPSEEVEKLEQQQLVRAALERLGGRCQRLLRLLYYGAEDSGSPPSYEEIGKSLDMPVGSIGPTRLRCLKKLLTEFRAMSLEGESE